MWFLLFKVAKGIRSFWKNLGIVRDFHVDQLNYQLINDIGMERYRYPESLRLNRSTDYEHEVLSAKSEYYEVSNEVGMEADGKKTHCCKHRRTEMNKEMIALREKVLSFERKYRKLQRKIRKPTIKNMKLKKQIKRNNNATPLRKKKSLSIYTITSKIDRYI